MFQIESNASWYYEISDSAGAYYLYLGGPNLPFGGWSCELLPGKAIPPRGGAGLRDGNKIYLAVWNLEEEGPVTVNIPHITAAVFAYPTSSAAVLTWDAQAPHCLLPPLCFSGFSGNRDKRMTLHRIGHRFAQIKNRSKAAPERDGRKSQRKDTRPIFQRAAHILRSWTKEETLTRRRIYCQGRR